MMPPMIIYKQGDVILLKFPDTKLTVFKKRPAVIINTDWFFYLRGDYVVIALTSQLPRDCYDIPIINWRSAGLLKPSVARIGKFITVHPSLIDKKLGKLNSDDFSKVLQRTNWVFT